MFVGLESGTVIAERYRLDQLKGEGGMGSVWSAKHLLTHKPVALKFLKTELTGNEQLVERFTREARAASAVRHPNVVQVHDILKADDGTPVMVMDLLDGESLGDRLEREGTIALGEVARIILPVISAIGAAHQAGIVHRDLKPDNIFLDRQLDGTVVPKVLDFGIAKLNPIEGEGGIGSPLTRTGAMLGTPYYMSVEQAFGQKDIDHRTDVWALGVILYECLSGSRPVDGENFGQLFKALMTGTITPLESVAGSLPVGLIDLVNRMLSTDRVDRPDLGQVREVLQRFTDVTIDSVPPAMPPLRPSTPNTQTLDRPSAPAKSGAIDPITGTPTSVTAGGVQRVMTSSKRRRIAAGVGAAVVAIAAGVFALAAGSGAVTAEANSSPHHKSVVAGAELMSEAPIDITPSASASSSAAPKTEPRVAKAEPKRPAPSAAPADPPPAPTPAPTPKSTRVQGGVVGEAPF